MSARLAGLYRYPLKSAAGERLEQAGVDALGLVGDRRWMLVDPASGRCLTQRDLPQVTRLSPRWLPDRLLLADGEAALEVPFPPRGQARPVDIWESRLSALDAGDDAARWLAERLGRACRLVALPEGAGIPIDPRHARPGEATAFTDGYPFLLTNRASLDDLSGRVGRPLAMRRFRPNLVVEGGAAYAEDGWRRLRIGEVRFRVACPCVRCVVVNLDPEGGERSADREPLATLARYRRGEGGVLFGVNLVAEGPGRIAAGMAIEILD